MSSEIIVNRRSAAEGTDAHFMRYRYTKALPFAAFFTVALILQHGIELVPVVGLEPTRLFIVPGF